MTRSLMHRLPACVLAAIVCGPTWSSEQPGDAQFVGNWTGVRHLEAAHYTGREGVDLQILQGADGLRVFDRTRIAVGEPLVPLERHGRDIRATWAGMLGRTSLVGRLSLDGKHLEIEIKNEMDVRRDSVPLTLSRDDPNAARYFKPGATHVASDIETPPPELGDGWKVGSPSSGGLNATVLQQMLQSVGKQTRDPQGNQTDGLLIAIKGRLVFEKYFWGYDRETPHEISSDTKSVTSILTGIAADRGALRVTDPVFEYFPDYASTHWVKERYPITLENVLSMTANIEWNEDLPYQDPGNTAIGLAVAADPIGYVLDRKQDGTPGSKFQYNSGLPNLVGDVVSRVTKEPLERFAAAALFGPLGIHNYYWTTQKNGHVLAAGGLFLLPRDMAKIGQLMLSGGTWDGRRIVSKEWVDVSTRQHTPLGDYAYGYFWHLATALKPRLAGEEGFMAIGQGGQYIVVLPHREAVIVVTSSNWQPGGTKLALVDLINRFVIPALGSH